MPTLAPPKTLGQDAIAEKIKNLLNQLPLKDRLEVEGEVTRSVCEQLAAKKEEFGKNNKKWAEYLQNHGITKKDAAKRIKLMSVPKLLWSVGTVMTMQLAAPMFEDSYPDLMKQNVLTQELVEQQMADVRSLRKQERDEVKSEQRADVESKFLEWTRNIHGIRTLQATIHEAAGNKLEYFYSMFRKASDSSAEFTLFVNELLQVYESSERWEEIEAMSTTGYAYAQYNDDINITPENIPFSKVGKGVRVEIVNRNSPRFGQQATVDSTYGSGGWTVVFDSKIGDEQPQSEWVGVSEVIVVAVH